ncbi:MAG: HEAT repeat domain-containing protein [Nitrospirae bacterium]|nr:HEAT repeat domain-containing protein [Nitrospirota bacterium]
MTRLLLIGLIGAVSAFVPSFAQASGHAEWAHVVPAQMPFDAPPKPEAAPDVSVPPSSKPLDSDEVKRAEALLPLLEGKQEFWAMGEFVHLGAPAVPVLVKALKMPGARTRYNAIETLLMMKEPGAVPALIEVAKEPNEMPRIREHALRVAVRLDPAQVPPAIELMAKDSNPTIRKAAAFEARYVRHKAVIPSLIGLISDDERFVAITAVNSLWLLTRHESEMHDWDVSTKQDRVEWAQEWIDWWKANQETFELPGPRRPKKPL